jgi:ABC-2 type transport system ATP-binding protein
MSSGPHPEVLVANNLQKAYGNRQALWDLTFSLRGGRILGFLGPNGAGKTTSIRILTTMLEPDAGKYTVEGIKSDQPQEIRRRIGVLPENPGFPRQMTGIEYLTYYGQLYGRTSKAARKRGMLLLEEVGMTQRANSLIGSYSHGMRQRMGIARALINDPIVVFFDEPTLGLDPRGQQELLEMIRRIARERGSGVVLCSHLLSEIESVCDDVVILNRGQVVARGTVSEIIGRTEQNIVLKNAARILIPVSLSINAMQVLKGLPNIDKITRIGDEGWLQILFLEPGNGDASTQLASNTILSALIRAKIPILGYEIEGARFKLQDVFLHLTEETIG